MGWVVCDTFFWYVDITVQFDITVQYSTKNAGQQVQTFLREGCTSFLSLFLLPPETLLLFCTLFSTPFSPRRWTWKCCVKIMDVYEYAWSWNNISRPHSMFHRCPTRMPCWNNPWQDGGTIPKQIPDCDVQTNSHRLRTRQRNILGGSAGHQK